MDQPQASQQASLDGCACCGDHLSPHGLHSNTTGFVLPDHDSAEHSVQICSHETWQALSKATCIASLRDWMQSFRHHQTPEDMLPLTHLTHFSQQTRHVLCGAWTPLPAQQAVRWPHDTMGYSDRGPYCPAEDHLEHLHSGKPNASSGCMDQDPVSRPHASCLPEGSVNCGHDRWECCSILQEHISDSIVCPLI